MNGPFCLQGWGCGVMDKDCKVIATGEGSTDEEERANAEMVCAALNAIYYASKAAGSAS
ncbi:hypothetical protein D3C85_929360 [compost metagenome]